MHISIEGIDGVGKSTVSKLVAEKLGFAFVEKPLKFLFDENGKDENYLKIRDYVNSQSNRVFTSWFYGLQNIYLYNKFAGQNIVTDRHLLSNYCWSGEAESEEIFDLLVKKIGSPDFTFIIYGSPDVVAKRIIGRDLNDKDIKKIAFIATAYEKMERFCKKHKMPYMLMDSDKLTVNEEVQIILSKIKEIAK